MKPSREARLASGNTGPGPDSPERSGHRGLSTPITTRAFLRFARPPRSPGSSPPTIVSSTSTWRLGDPGRGSPSPCATCAATPTPSGSCPARAASAVRARRRRSGRATYQTAANQLVNGVRVPAKIVPRSPTCSYRGRPCSGAGRHPSATSRRRSRRRICTRSLTPAQPLEVAQARGIVPEPRHELVPVARVSRRRRPAQSRPQPKPVTSRSEPSRSCTWAPSTTPRRSPDGDGEYD